MATQRWKTKERDIARLLQRIDGPPRSAVLRSLQTSTGRLGHLSDLQVDSASRTFAIEIKCRKLPVWLIQAWCQINERAREFGLEPLLALTIAAGQHEKTYQHAGKTYKTPELCIITFDRLEALLACERALNP